MTIRERKSVWALGPDPAELDWYRRAIAELQQRPQSDPTSWVWMAFVHGYPSNVTPPPGANAFWAACQHQSWFFLPWHRGYLAAFEAVIAQTIADLGGPADWALPYWDYSEPLTQNPNARLMPPAFVDRTLPGGARNALWAPRRAVAGGDFGLDDFTVDTSALGERRFSRSSAGGNSGFGGPRTGWSHAGNDNGLLESAPHNYVHGAIGGWMGSTSTAGLDPIFWLHRCNIDRLWEVWRRKWPASAPPTDPAWASNQSFTLHDGKGQPFAFTSAATIDTTKVLHGYTYAGISPTADQDDQTLGDGASLETAAMAELIGASVTGVDLARTPTRVALRLQPSLGPELLDDTGAGEGRLWLKLENVTGTGAPGNFRIFADMPGDDFAAIQIGLLSTFGIERASIADGTHGGGGITASIEITAYADRLGVTDHRRHPPDPVRSAIRGHAGGHRARRPSGATGSHRGPSLTGPVELPNRPAEPVPGMTRFVAGARFAPASRSTASALQLSSTRWVLLITVLGLLGLQFSDGPRGMLLCGRPYGIEAAMGLPWIMLVRSAQPLTWLAHWSAMMAATMAILAFPMARIVEARSFRTLRTSATLAFVLGYLAIWSGAGLAYFALTLALPFVTSTAGWALAAIFGIAAAAQLSPGQAARSMACHRIDTIEAFGWPAISSAHAFGLRFGGRCLASSWHLMLAMMATPHYWATLMIVPLCLVMERGRQSFTPIFGLAAITLFVLTSLFSDPGNAASSIDVGRLR